MENLTAAGPAKTPERAISGPVDQEIPEDQAIAPCPTTSPDSAPTSHWESGQVLTLISSFPRDFGKYELLEELGRGGMGVVYKARQKGLERMVAIKMILSNHLATAKQIERFHIEARAAAKLKDSRIVGIIEADELHGQHYFAMEYIAGPNLATLVKRGPLDTEVAARILREVALAVAHLHVN